MLIRGISDNQILSSEYTILRFYLKGARNGKKVVKGLPTKLLMGVDILDAARIDIIFSQKLAMIQSYKTTAPLSVSITQGNHRFSQLLIFQSRPTPHDTYLDVKHSAQFGQDSFWCSRLMPPCSQPARHAMTGVMLPFRRRPRIVRRGRDNAPSHKPARLR